MDKELLLEIKNLRQLFAEVAPTDEKTIERYAWLIVRVLSSDIESLDSLTCRQLLLDALNLNIQRPSKLYSSILAASLKVAKYYPDFHFISFLRIWDIHNIRPIDKVGQKSEEYCCIMPSLAERVGKTYTISKIIHPDDALPDDHYTIMKSFLVEQGYAPLQRMIVTRIKEGVNEEGRKFVFATLTSSEGIEVDCISNALLPNPLHPLPQGKRHFVNIGQLYDVQLKLKKAQNEFITNKKDGKDFVVSTAYQSRSNPFDYFQVSIGFVEHIDSKYQHIHIYDSQSRHFVAHLQRFSKEQEGDLVRFIPITPRNSKFKTAILLSRTSIPDECLYINQESQANLSNHEQFARFYQQGLTEGLVREIRITSVNTEKSIAAWELTDPSKPITELLSPIQIYQGEKSPSFTNGYVDLAKIYRASTIDSSSVLEGSQPKLSPGQTIHAIIYLRRGKDRLKRPYVARILSL